VGAFASERRVVAVLMGGTTGEREVSLETGRALAASAERLGHAVRVVEVIADGGAGRARWQLAGWTGGPAAALAGPLSDVDVFLLGLHGGFGEGGPLQGLLSSEGRRFTGSGLAASSLCLDKTLALVLADANGLRTAERLTAPAGRPRAEVVRETLALAARHAGVVIKPRRGGSSVATMVLGDGALTEEAVDHALRAVEADGDEPLVEARVQGVEVTAGFVELDGQLRALPLVEIRPKAGRFFDYEEKYSAGGALELCPAESLAPDVAQRVQDLGRTIFLAAGCSGYGRVDFIVPPKGAPVFLELNTLPGMTPRSLLPQAAEVFGLDFDALSAALLEHAWRAGGERT